MTLDHHGELNVSLRYPPSGVLCSKPCGRCPLVRTSIRGRARVLPLRSNRPLSTGLLQSALDLDKAGRFCHSLPETVAQASTQCLPHATEPPFLFPPFRQPWQAASAPLSEPSPIATSRLERTIAGRLALTQRLLFSQPEHKGSSSLRPGQWKHKGSSLDLVRWYTHGAQRLLTETWLVSEKWLIIAGRSGLRMATTAVRPAAQDKGVPGRMVSYVCLSTTVEPNMICEFCTHQQPSSLIAQLQQGLAPGADLCRDLGATSPRRISAGGD